MFIDSESMFRHIAPMITNGTFMNLQSMIRERGLKQNWVAKQIGMTKSHFSEMIRGKKRVPVKIIEPLARLLQVDVAAIISAATEHGE